MVEVAEFCEEEAVVSLVVGVVVEAPVPLVADVPVPYEPVLELLVLPVLELGLVLLELLGLVLVLLELLGLVDVALCEEEALGSLLGVVLEELVLGVAEVPAPVLLLMLPVLELGLVLLELLGLVLLVEPVPCAEVSL